MKLPLRLVLLGGLAGCSGTIAPGPEISEPTPPPPPATTVRPPPTPSGPAVPGRAPLRRLNRQEYNNTVRDLLGDTTRPADQFPSDEAPGAFSNGASSAQISPEMPDIYRAAAERLAATAVQKTPALTSCAGADEACARQLIESFGLRAYRRPLSAGEVDGLLAVFRVGRQGGTYAEGIETTLAAMLQSPHFLYRLESASGAAGEIAALGPYETATRLSYFLWSSMPDDQLFAAAKAGKLGTAAEVQLQARRMLKDPKTGDSLREFFRQWMMLAILDTMSKDRQALPEFSDDLRRAMRDEALRFVTSVVMEGDRRFATLLTSARSYPPTAVAARIYGVPNHRSDAYLDLAPSQRAGLLTMPALMAITAHASETSPTRRGKFVRDQLMCQPPPDPPADEDLALPESSGNARERYAAHLANPACAACHRLMDPVGFAFESYDPIGRYRNNVDVSGEMVSSEDLDGPFVGAVELARRLARSRQVQRCFVETWFQFAHGRRPEATEASALVDVEKAFAQHDGDVHELLVALTATVSFRARQLEVTR